jgi:putative transposase
MAREAVEQRDISIRLACEALFISQDCYRYEPQLNDEEKPGHPRNFLLKGPVPRW